MDVLFRWGNDLVLGGSLQVGEFGHSLVDDIQSLLDLSFGNDQRRGQTDDVLVSGFGLEWSV